MTTALLKMARGEAISDQYLINVVRAKQINQQVGGFMVAPWDLDQLPEDWLMVFDRLANEYPGMQKAQAEISGKLAELRKRYVH